MSRDYTFIDYQGAVLVLRNPLATNTKVFQAMNVINAYNKQQRLLQEQKEKREELNFQQAYRHAKGL